MKKHIKATAGNTKVKFAAVGVINTVIDFAILNLLAHSVGLPRIPSNIVSASVAMVFSFFANRSVVFDSKEADHKRQMLMFVIVTVSSVYLLQNAVIYVLADLWTWPLHTAHDWLGLLDREVFVTNSAKLVATGASLVWNFLFYDRLVFKSHEQK